MRDELGQFTKGHKHIGGFSKGSKHSEGSKEKIRLSLLGKRGELSRNWQGGKTPQGVIIRYSSESKAWRKSVLERDKYTCQVCGKIGGRLDVDHIRPFAYFPELRLELSNGRTLCHPCHKKTDTFAYKAIKQYAKS